MFSTPLHNRAWLPIVVAVVLGACNSDLKDEPVSSIGTIDSGDTAGGAGGESAGDTSGDTSAGSSADGNPVEAQPATTDGTGNNELFSVQVGSGSLALEEGAASATIEVVVNRLGAHRLPITLSAAAEIDSDAASLSWEFNDTRIDSTENGTALTFQMAIGQRPIQPQNRVIRITATDGRSQPVDALLTLQITPTGRPDIYLLAGQSNMIGFSESGAKQGDEGEADAPVDRILQLNVTGNDLENFETAADFTDSTHIAAPDPRFVPAVDPLHDGYDTTIFGKAGTFVGPGLSFAKRALQDTTATIYLVPAAWSDTGFCKRDTNRVAGIGWNATAKTDQALSGTLLHDRAITRTNLVIEETGGILRGILWHQGEADADDTNCAAVYEENMVELVASLRSSIIEDARGPAARGADADVPFIAGSMSKGADSRGALAPFTETKQFVDAVHRTIDSLVPHSALVNNDDLVPPDYPCGEGSCIHFGAAAYREMGARYYAQLLGVVGD